MRRILLIACLVILYPLVGVGQTDTPTSTPTATPTDTPTSTPTVTPPPSATPCRVDFVRLGNEQCVEYYGSTVGASQLEWNASCVPEIYRFETSPDVTHEYVVPLTGSYTVRLGPEDFDAFLVVHDGACSGAEIGCDSVPVGTEGQVILSLNANDTIYVNVDGRTTASAGAYYLWVWYEDICPTPTPVPTDTPTKGIYYCATFTPTPMDTATPTITPTPTNTLYLIPCPNGAAGSCVGNARVYTTDKIGIVRRPYGKPTEIPHFQNYAPLHPSQVRRPGQ